MNDKMSVIIPVYNVEKWLNKCVESVLQQTYENLEIILINDGSNDSSGAICDDYASNDSRVIVIHNQNSGLSVTRNIGIKEATGNYIMFLDSDDYLLDGQILNRFVEIFNKENCDFIYTSYCRFDDGNEDMITEVLPLNVNTNKLSDKTGIDCLTELIRNNSYHHAAYLKICKRDFLVENNLFFKEGIYHEDAEWSPKLFYYANKVAIYKDSFYMRRMREDSIITTTDEKKISKKICDRMEVAYELVLFFNTVKESMNINVIINDLLRMYWGDLTSIVFLKQRQNIKLCCQLADKNNKIFSYSKGKRYKFIYYFVSLTRTSLFLKLYKLR